MPKPGNTTIIVNEPVRSTFEEIAEVKGYRSINRLPEAWIRVNPTSINGEIRHSRNESEIGFF